MITSKRDLYRGTLCYAFLSTEGSSYFQRVPRSHRQVIKRNLDSGRLPHKVGSGATIKVCSELINVLINRG